MSEPYSYRILVCGGRDYNDWETVNRTLTQYCLDNDLMLGCGSQSCAASRRRGGQLNNGPCRCGNGYPNLPDVTIIHGGAKGADALAMSWAAVNWCPEIEFKADWAKHGRAAGPIRNKQMLEKGKPDVVIAFKGGRGTANMCRQAREAGVKVIEVP